MQVVYCLKSGIILDNINNIRITVLIFLSFRILNSSKTLVYLDLGQTFLFDDYVNESPEIWMTRSDKWLEPSMPAFYVVVCPRQLVSCSGIHIPHFRHKSCIVTTSISTKSPNISILKVTQNHIYENKLDNWSTGSVNSARFSRTLLMSGLFWSLRIFWTAQKGTYWTTTIKIKSIMFCFCNHGWTGWKYSNNALDRRNENNKK